MSICRVREEKNARSGLRVIGPGDGKHSLLGPVLVLVADPSAAGETDCCLLPAAQQFFKRVHARNVISQNMPFSTCRWFSLSLLSLSPTHSFSLSRTHFKSMQSSQACANRLRFTADKTYDAGVSAHPLDPKLRNESRSRFWIRKKRADTVIRSQVDAMVRNNGPSTNNGSLFSPRPC